jgi:uncharacterized protein
MKIEPPYSLKNGAESSSEYYMEVSNFTDHVLSEAEIQIGCVIDDYKARNLHKSPSRDLMVFEALMIGVLWRAYIKRAVKLNYESQKLLANLSRKRDENEELKQVIDHDRGILATSVLLPEDTDGEIPELTSENLNKLLKWLEATGEFQEELKHLNSWIDFLGSLNPQIFFISFKDFHVCRLV